MLEVNGFNFVCFWNNMCTEVDKIASSKGFNMHPLKPEYNAMKIALIHSELSEALEALRHGNPLDDKIPEFTGAEAELADAVIRIMHLAYRNKWNVGEAIIAKMKFNETREQMHGGKLF